MKTSALIALFAAGCLSVALAAEPPADVLLIDHAKVDAAFAQGSMVSSR
jgi:hypothetical protein